MKVNDIYFYACIQTVMNTHICDKNIKKDTEITSTQLGVSGQSLPREGGGIKECSRGMLVVAALHAWPWPWEHACPLCIIYEAIHLWFTHFLCIYDLLHKKICFKCRFKKKKLSYAHLFLPSGSILKTTLSFFKISIWNSHMCII